MKHQKPGIILLYIASAAIVAFGAIYIYTGFTSGLMPYHKKFLGVTGCGELPPNVCKLMRTFVQIVGFAFTAIGITFFQLARAGRNSHGADSRRMLWMIVVCLIPVAPIMYHLAPYTPWYIVAGIMVLSVAALVLIRPSENRIKSRPQ